MIKVRPSCSIHISIASSHILNYTPLSSLALRQTSPSNTCQDEARQVSTIARQTRLGPRLTTTTARATSCFCTFDIRSLLQVLDEALE